MVFFFATFASPQAAHAFALAAKQNITFQGNAIVVDSFDSSDPNYSTQGLYDPAKRKDNGDVITSSGTVDVSNAQIMGHVRTAPGGTVSLGPVGAVGEIAWVQGGQPGIEPGWWVNDLTAVWPDAALPAASWLTPTIQNTNIDGFVYMYSLQTSGDWVIANLTGGLYVGSNAVVRLMLTGSARPSMIRIAAGGRLKLYMAGPMFGATYGVINDSGNATNFQYSGLPANTNIGISFNGAYVGTIYAPSADLTVGHGGSATYDFVGCSLTRSLVVNGHMNFHFDENLLRTGPLPPWITAHPQPQALLAGTNATFNVVAGGSQPLSYQWLHNGSSINSATNSSLILSNVSPADAAAYSVLVTNSFGSITSTQASLSVHTTAAALLGAPACSAGNQFQFSVVGVPGYRYQVQTSSNLTDWIPLQTNVAPFIFVDRNALGFSQRYYRAIWIY